MDLLFFKAVFVRVGFSPSKADRRTDIDDWITTQLFVMPHHDIVWYFPPAEPLKRFIAELLAQTLGVIDQVLDRTVHDVAIDIAEYDPFVLLLAKFKPDHFARVGKRVRSELYDVKRRRMLELVHVEVERSVIELETVLLLPNWLGERVDSDLTAYKHGVDGVVELVQLLFGLERFNDCCKYLILGQCDVIVGLLHVMRQLIILFHLYEEAEEDFPLHFVVWGLSDLIHKILHENLQSIAAFLPYLIILALVEQYLLIFQHRMDLAEDFVSNSSWIFHFYFRELLLEDDLYELKKLSSMIAWWNGFNFSQQDLQ